VTVKADALATGAGVLEPRRLRRITAHACASWRRASPRGGMAFFDPRGADAPAFEAVVGVSTICSLSPRGSAGHDDLERLAMSSRAIMLMRSFRAFFSAPIRPAMTTIDGSTWQALRAEGRGFVKVTNRDDASLIAYRKLPVVCEIRAARTWRQVV
jgi:hypothetical protein